MIKTVLTVYKHCLSVSDVTCYLMALICVEFLIK